MSKVIAAGLVLQAIGATLLGTHAPPAQAFDLPVTMNDTGLTLCAVFAHRGYRFSPHCEGTGQDALFGRDAALPSNGDGHGGFSFQKIDGDGHRLPRHSLDWRCVLDTTTGLEWEVQTANGGLFDYRNRYTNLNNGAADDAGTLVTVVNSVGLCGASDWRLPSRGELESIMDYSHAGLSATVDPDWFPNSVAAMHWTSTRSKVNGGGKNYWWAVDFLEGSVVWRGGRFDADPVRLVRGGQPGPARRWKILEGHEDEVIDQQTHRVWRRCAEGRAWTGSTCAGAGRVFLQSRDAMDYAVAEAERTGMPWRAPNVKELSSLVDTKVQDPSIDQAVFPDFEDDHYHTGTFDAANPFYNWHVRFGDGVVQVEFYAGRLLMVRDETSQSADDVGGLGSEPVRR
jgi:hypothetical protein